MTIKDLFITKNHINPNGFGKVKNQLGKCPKVIGITIVNTLPFDVQSLALLQRGDFTHFNL
jgi:hypothetical protein